MLKVVHENDPVVINRIKSLIYGQPGAGKTSLSFTANKPFLLDFDDGAYRSDYRKTYGAMSNWQDVANLKREDFLEYSTIIIDTVDTALAYLAEQILKEDAKNGNRNGGLTLQGYGVLKSRFSQWLTQLTLWGLDVIMIAHAKEEKEGEYVKVRPQITGGSYDFIIQKSDFIGYLHKINDKTTLSFSPCERWYGKNSAGFPLLTIPNFEKEPAYFAGIIQQMKDALSKKSNAQVEAINRLKEKKAEIQAIQDGDAEALNKYAQDLVDDKTLSNAEKMQLFTWLKERGEKELHCMFIIEPGSKKGKFFPPAKPDPEPEKPETQAATTESVEEELPFFAK